MGINKYIPKKSIAVDRRKPSGGYYEATCNECGQLFYPIKSNALYCCRNCQLIAWRRKNAIKDDGNANLPNEQFSQEILSKKINKQ